MFADEEIKINQDLKLSTKLWSTRCSETFEGEMCSTAQRVIVVRTSTTITDNDLKNNLKNRLDKVASSIATTAQGINILKYGFDSENKACIIFDYFESTSVLSSREFYSVRFRLVIQLMQKIEDLNNLGILIEDFNEESFRLVNGELVFIPGFGSIDQIKGGTMALPKSSSMIFMAPELLKGGAPTLQTDLYGAAVLSYYLLVAKDLPEDNKDIDNFLSTNPSPTSINEEVPLWLQDLLASSLEIDPSNRFSDAGRFLNYLEEGVRDGGLDVSKVKSGTWVNNDVIVKPAAEVKRSDKISKELEKAGELKSVDIDTSKSKKSTKAKEKKETTKAKKIVYLIWAITIATGIIVSFFVLTSLKFIRIGSTSLPPSLEQIRVTLETDAELRDLIVLGSEEELIAARKDALSRLLKRKISWDKSIIDYINTSNFSTQFVSALVDVPVYWTKSLGKDDEISNFINSWVTTVSGINEGIPDQKVFPLQSLLLQVIDPSVTVDKKITAGRLLFAFDKLKTITLSALLAKEESNSYQVAELRQLLTGLGYSKIPNTFMIPQLALLSPEILSTTGLSIEKATENIKQEEYKRIIEVLLTSPLAVNSNRDFLINKYVSVNATGVFSKELIKISNDISALDKYTSVLLLKLALQAAQSEDLTPLMEWSQERWENVLYLGMAIGQTSEVNNTLLNILSRRAPKNDTGKILYEWLKTNVWSVKSKYAKAYASLVLKDLCTPEQIEEAFSTFMPVSQNALFETFLKMKDSFFTKQAVIRIGPIMSTEQMMPLLNSNDKEVRILAIRSLAGKNDLKSLQNILRAFRKEKDEDVIAVYKELHWVTQDRDILKGK